MISVNTGIIIATAILSLICFSDRGLFYKLSLSPYCIYHKNQWWRVITHGFIHADYMHLLINMLVLWSFGRNVELLFVNLEQHNIISNGTNTYTVLYLSAIVFSSIYDVAKQKDNYKYNSIGASGAVSAVLFCSIFFSPWSKVYVMGIIPIPGIIFGIIYIWYSQYMNKKGGDNTNHLAHIWGAIYGFVFSIIVEPKLLSIFLNAI